MNFQTALNNFIHPDDQDAFARSQGWEDAAQMCYYEDLAMAEEDRQREEAAQAKLALGVLQEQKGKPDAALRLYDEILRAKKQSVWRAEAEMRREQVVRKHPQLAPGAVSVAAPVPATNAPAAPTKATDAPAKK